MKSSKPSTSVRAPKTLDEFPEEILVNIFKSLSFKDLLRLSSTCKKFLQVTSSSNIVDKFKLHLKDKKILSGLRKYHNVDVDAPCVDFFPPFFIKIGNSITDLNLGVEEGKFEATSILKIIKKCPSLKNLKIHTSNDSVDNFEELPGLSLNSFSFIGPFGLFGCFKKFQTKHLSIELREEKNSEHRAHFIDFLVNQNDLKTLDLEGSLHLDQFTDNQQLLEVKFRLEKLSLHGRKCFGKTLAEVPQVLRNFVLLHRDSLKELQLCDKTHKYLAVVAKFPNLKVLHLEEIFHMQETLMPQVEELELIFCSGRFIKSFPNTKILKLTREFEATFSIYELKHVEEFTLEDSTSFLAFTLPKTVKKFRACKSHGDYYPDKYQHVYVNNVEEFEFEDCKKNDWLVQYLKNSTAASLKIKLINMTIYPKLKTFLEDNKDKIELKVINCEYSKKSAEPETDFDLVRKVKEGESSFEKSRNTMVMRMPDGGIVQYGSSFGFFDSDEEEDESDEDDYEDEESD